MTETRPSSLIFGLIAVALAATARYADIPVGWRAFCAAASIVFAVPFVFYVVDLFVYLLGKARAAYHYPILRQLEAVRGMSDLQLRVVLSGYVHVAKIPTNHGLVTRYQAPGLTDSLTPERVKHWADTCATWERWPELPALHGYSDGSERAELRAFTAIVTALGIADPAVGPSPARWTVRRDKVYERLEV